MCFWAFLVSSWSWKARAEAAAAVLGAVLDVAHLAIALAHVDAVVIRALVFVGPARAPVAAAVPTAVRVGRAGGKLRRVKAPAHGARKRPLVAAPHHHVRLVVVLLVEHDVARAEGGVGDVGGAFLDLLLFAQLRKLRAPRRALGRNGRAATQLPHRPSAREWDLGCFWHAGQPFASGSSATQQPWHIVPLALRPVRAPLALALGGTCRLPPCLPQCVSSMDRVGWSHSAHLRQIWQPEITPRNPFFSSHARRSASVLGLRPMASYQFQWGHKSKGLVCRFGNAQVARFGAHSSARFLPLAAALMASSLATAAFFLSATSS